MEHLHAEADRKVSNADSRAETLEIMIEGLQQQLTAANKKAMDQTRDMDQMMQMQAKQMARRDNELEFMQEHFQKELDSLQVRFFYHHASFIPLKLGGTGARLPLPLPLVSAAVDSGRRVPSHIQ